MQDGLNGQFSLCGTFCISDSSSSHAPRVPLTPKATLVHLSTPRSIPASVSAHDSQGPGPRRSITKATVTGMVMAWLVIGLEKVREVDRGPWLPAAGSEMLTVYVTKLGSPEDFSF